LNNCILNIKKAFVFTEKIQLEKNMKNEVENIMAKSYPGTKNQKCKSEPNRQIMSDLLFYPGAHCIDVLKTDFYC